MATTDFKKIQAPRGTDLSCLGWQQEAAMRMLMNNLDAEVAEHPEELIVYGGSGKAARNQACYEAIIATLLASSARMMVTDSRVFSKGCKTLIRFDFLATRHFTPA